MASIRKHRSKRQVQVHRADHSPTSRSFMYKADAVVWARVVDWKMDSGELVADQQVLNELSIRDLLIRYEETVSPSKRRAKVESDKIDLLLCHSLRSSVFLLYDQVQNFNIGL